MTETIKPCPFCGRDEAQVGGYAGNKWVCCVDTRCEASGPSRPTDAEAIAAWNAAPRLPRATPPPPPGTVRVRVAVSVSAEGSWGASGGSNPDFDPVDALRDTDDYTDAHRLSWIVADVPKPKPAAEIEAEVEPTAENR